MKAVDARRAVGALRADGGERVGTLGKPLQALVLGVLSAYRWVVSPLLPPACRFEPSCSRYAEEAVGRHGVLRGGWLAVKRLGRCHPLGGSGFDPVP